MKKTILLILAIFIGIAANSQVKKIDKLPGSLYCGKEKNEDFFKNAEYIFEGYAIDTKTFLNNDTTKVYVSSKVRVMRLLKGKLGSDTVEFVVDGGKYITDHGVTILDDHSGSCLNMERSMIYFAKKREGITFNDSLQVKIEPYLNSRYASLYYSHFPEQNNFSIFGLKHMYFKRHYDFYKYASKFEGVNVPPSLIAKSQIEKIDKLPGSLYCGKEKNEDFFKNAEYIFEGEVLNSSAFLNKDTTKVYGSAAIRVLYQFKGALKSDTVELIVEGGEYGTAEDGPILNDNSDFCFGIRQNMIFFAKKREGVSFNDSLQVKIEPFINFRYASLYYSEMPWKHNFLIYGLKHMYFKTKEDFYKYASKFEGINVPPDSKKKTAGKQRSQTGAATKAPCLYGLAIPVAKPCRAKQKNITSAQGHQ